ncbi:MAG: inositol monophosphatase family protein, partial [Opitutaceae bacterium]
MSSVSEPFRQAQGPEHAEGLCELCGEDWNTRRNFVCFVYFVGNSSSVDLTPYRTFIAELAQSSGDFIRPFFGDPNLAVETKSDDSPVTLADRGAEELMRGLIGKKFPDHGIIGEELGSENANAEWVWVLDPIDGTKSFITGVPLWGTLIALLHNGQPVLGCIHQPILRQLLIGNGAQTTLNGRAVRLRNCPRIEDAVVLTSDLFNPGKYQNGPAYSAFIERAKLVRTWGDCYGYLLLAGGWADVMLDPV